MPSSDIDFDPSNSSLQIGMEVEYPIAGSLDERLINRGRESNGLQSAVDSLPGIAGRPVYDGTVGLEVVSDVLDLEDAPQWYSSVIDHIESEYNELYQPTGLLRTGSTAGLHIHLSELSRDKAQELADISAEPWAQVLFCSSIASDDDGVAWPVFRGGRYCDLNFGSSHYNVVNGRGGGHYEWRLPEPMVAEHVEILVQFLRIFEQSTEDAIEYAQEVLDNADDRITSLQRSERIGMDMEEVPTVERQPSPADPEGFYETIQSEWHYPEIYTVELGGNEFYTFDTRLEGTFTANGISFRSDEVLRADELEPVNDDELSSTVRRALNRRGNETRETEATEELKKVLKKKKA